MEVSPSGSNRLTSLTFRFARSAMFGLGQEPEPGMLPLRRDEELALSVFFVTRRPNIAR